MKRIFFTVFLVFIITSCEDDINSPNADFVPQYGCADELACNYELGYNTNDGSCIFNQGECDQYDLCEEGNWVHHTCVNTVDDSAVPNWNGNENNCTLTHFFCPDVDNPDCVGDENMCKDYNGVDYENWSGEYDDCLNGHVFTPGNCNTNSDDGGSDN